MTIVFVQSATARTLNTGATATTGGITTTTGNAILMGDAVFPASQAFVSVSDNGTANSWALDCGPQAAGSGSPEGRIHSNTNINGKVGHTFTVTSAGTSYMAISVGEFSGVATSTAFDQKNSHADTLTANPTSNATPAGAAGGHVAYGLGTTTGSLAGSVVANAPPWVAEGNTGDGTVAVDIITGHNIVTDGSAQTFTWTLVNATAVNIATLIATYKEATASGVVEQDRIMMLGVS